MRAYQKFLRAILRPLGIFAMVIGFVAAVLRALPEVRVVEKVVEKRVEVVVMPDSVAIAAAEQARNLAFATECGLRNSFVVEINGVTFCVDAKGVPGISAPGVNVERERNYNQRCMNSGGRSIDLTPARNDLGCYRITIHKDMGARHAYVPTR